MAALDLQSLKEYVKGGNRKTNPGTVLLDFKHNLLTANYTEIAFSIWDTVDTVKDRLYRMTGSKPEYMLLVLNGVPMEDHRTLQSYGVKNGTLIHVIDQDPFSLARNGGLEDVSLVKKYVMSDEEYDKRENTYRAWKKKMLAQDPNWRPKHLQNVKGKVQVLRPIGSAASSESKVSPPAETEEQVRERIKVGMRCQVKPGDRRGTVMYVGPVPEIPQPPELTAPLIWIGVKYDDPVGKNDGSIKGKRYFECNPKFGGFVKPELVEVGDFPELDPFDELEDEDDNDRSKEGEGEQQEGAAEDDPSLYEEL